MIVSVSYVPCDAVLTYWETAISYDMVVSVMCGFPLMEPTAVI